MALYKLIYMNKSSCAFSRRMLKFVQDKKLDYIFAGKDGQVLSTSNMLQLLLEMNNSEMIWKNLNGNLHEQEKAIKKVREHLLEYGFSTHYESNGKYFYLIINQ